MPEYAGTRIYTDDGTEILLPFAVFHLGPQPLSWQLCCCGEEISQIMFWVPAAGRWVCQRCAVQAALGEDLDVEFVYIRGERGYVKQVPLWWAERQGLDWFNRPGGDWGIAGAKDIRIQEIPTPAPAAAAIAVEDQAARRARINRLMSEPPVTMATAKQIGLFG